MRGSTFTDLLTTIQQIQCHLMDTARTVVTAIPSLSRRRFHNIIMSFFICHKNSLVYFIKKAPYIQQQDLPRKEKPTWCTTYSQDISSTSTCFGAYLGPSSGGTTLCIEQLVLIIPFRWLSVVPSSGATTKYIEQLVLIILFRWVSVVLAGLEFQSNQDNRESPKKNNKYQLLYTYSCTSWWWA